MEEPTPQEIAANVAPAIQVNEDGEFVKIEED